VGPLSCPRLMARWLGERLGWGTPLEAGLSCVGIASSRIGSPSGRQSAWLAALRMACEQCDPAESILVSSPGTTTDRWLVRASRLLDRRLLQIILPDKREPNMASWLGNLPRRDLPAAGKLACWYLSPPWSTSSHDCPQPGRDAAVVAAADRLVVLALRRGGNLWNLLMARLNDPAWSAPSLVLAVGPGLVPRELARPLLDRGATCWQPDTGQSVPAETNTTDNSFHRVDPPLEPGQWLTHCTRGQSGPWPDQTEQQYLDQWLLDPYGTDYSAAAALARIVRQRCLRAGVQGIRGGYAVVSFTAAAPAELTKLHVYRRHRRRWDFEPYGIVIRRDWLRRRGTQPVQYGDATLWRRLPEEDRPFFQLRSTQSTGNRAAVDWTVEQEWRHLGDVSLADLPADQAVLLVPDLPSARRLCTLSRWPIALLPPSSPGGEGSA
jgi:hypothetical protein